MTGRKTCEIRVAYSPSYIQKITNGYLRQIALGICARSADLFVAQTARTNHAGDLRQSSQGLMMEPAMADDADVAEAVRLILHPDECFPPTFGELQIAVIRVAMALASAKAEEREACARVAESRHVHWRMPHPDDARPFEVCDDETACRDIAVAIRSRKDAP